jgi:hypothetical protein
MSMAEIMREVAAWPSERPAETKENEATWAEEAERRYSEVKSGKMKCVPGTEALRRVRLRNK